MKMAQRLGTSKVNYRLASLTLFGMQRSVPARKGPRVPFMNCRLTSSLFLTFFYFSILLSLSILHVAETFRRSAGTRLRRCENIKFLVHKLKDFPLRLRINFTEVEEESVCAARDLCRV